MNRYRPLILLMTVLLAGLLSYGLWTLPSPEPADAEGFSASRVVEDIEVISKEHHSVAHPAERAQVREYLAGRLEKLGADTIIRFRYDSLVGPKNKHVVYTFDAENLLAEFAPLHESDDTVYMMLVAHYDSRYSQPMPKKDTVWSYGAADDGYGVGVILETVSQALKQREHWKQGIKVLFTDAEETGMQGMSSQWENDAHIFDNVGMVVNLEARGPWGPVLLFETCPGNEKVMELYSEAVRYPYTYSLTTVVYTFMPNFTDFTIVKDHIPGLNFSTIADINHYHTDLDNFSNISAKSLQHYGEQVLPVVMTYLRGEEYGDKDYLKSDSDVTSFSFPLLGLFKFSRTTYLIINIVLLVVFLLLFVLEVIRGRVKFGRTLRNLGTTLLLALGILALGEFAAYCCASVAGAVFKPFGIVVGVGFDNVAMIVLTVLLVVLSVMIYGIFRAKAMRQVSGSMRKNAAANAAMHYAYDTLYGTMLLMAVLSLALLLAIGENMMFFIPLFFAVVAMILYHLTSLRLWMLVAVALTLLHAFSFLYALSMALTIGAFGAVAMLAFLDLMILIPLSDLYLSSYRK
ncbi:MAG: M28 family peptidase [Bacteroidales bacterium]|nr:M28 family peptidase [Bacteroidales bacterium]